MKGEKPRVIYRGCGIPEEDGTTTSDTGNLNYTAEILRRTPALQSKYEPPAVWGGNGHIQTALFSIMEERPGLQTTDLPSQRHSITLADNTTVTYEEFGVEDYIATAPDVSILICPGLANSGQNLYIKAFTIYALNNGYRVMCLNHVGAIPDIPLTSRRVFNFGSTEEYDAMVQNVRHKHPNTRLVAVGFSLGANIVTKYLGENEENQKQFILCISLCQGYDFIRMQEWANSWKKLRKLYLRKLTGKLKEVMLNHENTLLNEGEEHSCRTITRQDVKKCKVMSDLDDLVTIGTTGHSTTEEYYKWASSVHYIPKIKIPCLLLNASDDPLFSKKLFVTPRTHALQTPKTLFITTKHGGHLGFFEKTGKKRVDPHTWLEKMIVSYVTATVSLELGLPCQEDIMKQVKTIPRSITEPIISDSKDIENNLLNNNSERTTPTPAQHDQLLKLKEETILTTVQTQETMRISLTYSQ